jgi:predicted 2-oxoglutarate/Fe(II)-dependent dioxygenase YbiX
MEIFKVPALRDWLQDRSRRVIFPTLAAYYGFDPSELHYMDLFLVRYDADSSGAQRALRAHRDRSLLSFNILLSEPSDFDGGGTSFDVLGGEVVHPSHIGDLTIHPGKARHSGVAVSRGVRHVIVGFVGVRSPRVDLAFLRVRCLPRIQMYAIA